MSDLKGLINREIDRRQERLRGVVLTDPRLKTFDVTGGLFPTWVVDVDIGASRILQNVPVKINGPKARHYARAGSPVFLEKNEQGRYQVVAPADRVRVPGTVRLLDEDTGVFSAGGAAGISSTREPFEFYEGTGIPGGGLWHDHINGFPKITVVDETGTEINLS